MGPGLTFGYERQSRRAGAKAAIQNGEFEADKERSQVKEAKGFGSRTRLAMKAGSFVGGSGSSCEGSLKEKRHKPSVV